MFRSLKLDRGVAAVNAADPLSRQDAVYLFYNLLSARTKEGAPYIQALGHSLDASGKPDLVSLVNGEMEGPVVAQGGWRTTLPFTPSRVYRNGSLVSASAVQNYDVLYWNASMSTLWAYAKKATGPIQAIEPSGAAPTSVTVAGRSYPIESSAAAYALSDLLRSTSPGQPTITYDCLLNVGGEERWHRIVARATWSTDEPPRYMGAIGKATDIHDTRIRLDDLERQAASDSLTGLLNHTSIRPKGASGPAVLFGPRWRKAARLPCGDCPAPPSPGR